VGLYVDDLGRGAGLADLSNVGRRARRASGWSSVVRSVAWCKRNGRPFLSWAPAPELRPSEAECRSLMTSLVPTDSLISCIPSLAPKPPSGPDWVHEIKHDGYRLIVRRDCASERLSSTAIRPSRAGSYSDRLYTCMPRYPAATNGYALRRKREARTRSRNCSGVGRRLGWWR
jgi:hypothetical protein